MGVQRSMEMEIYVRSKTYFDGLRILFEHDWTPFDLQGKVTYLAPGDIDDFDFKTATTLDFVFQVLSEREARGEFGYMYVYDKQHRDMLTLSIYSRNKQPPYRVFEFHFGLGGAGKRLTGSVRHTDYSYYLERIVPVLEQEGFQFFQIKCHDLG